MKCVSNDYTNPNTKPKALTTLTLILTDPHCLIKKLYPQFQAGKLPYQGTRYELKFVSNNYTYPNTDPIRR